MKRMKKEKRKTEKKKYEIDVKKPEILYTPRTLDGNDLLKTSLSKRMK